MAIDHALKAHVVTIAKERLDALLPDAPMAVGRAKDWQEEREACLKHLDFFLAEGTARTIPMLIKKNAGRVIDILVAAGMPYADAFSIWDQLRRVD